VSYRKRLAAHPGKEIAAIFTVMFMVAAGNSGAGFWQAVLAGVIGSSPIWAVVLWTARTQPIPEDRKANQEKGHAE